MGTKLDKYLGNLEEPVFVGNAGKWFKKGPLRVIIINEDLSAKEHFMKWPSSYIIEILNKSYFMVPKCVLRMDKPTICFYYNNPFPIEFQFRYSDVSSLDFYSDEGKALLGKELETYLAQVVVDAEIVQLSFNNRFMKGIYGQGGLSIKNWLMIVGAVVLGILLILQLTGKVDVMGGISNIAGGAK